jgi:transcriptional regulator with XRE-family HTH domain
MARALLRLTMKDTAKLAGIDQGTIVRIEAGFNAYALTLQHLRQVLETAGARFIEPVEGDHGPGVALNWGVAPTARQPGEDAATGKAGEGGLKAAWDDFEETADLDALLSEEPGLNPDMAEMWRDDPELWARLSQGGRETLSRRMFGDFRAVDESYFRHGA